MRDVACTEALDVIELIVNSAYPVGQRIDRMFNDY